MKTLAILAVGIGLVGCRANTEGCPTTSAFGSFTMTGNSTPETSYSCGYVGFNEGTLLFQSASGTSGSVSITIPAPITAGSYSLSSSGGSAVITAIMGGADGDQYDSANCATPSGEVVISEATLSGVEGDGGNAQVAGEFATGAICDGSGNQIQDVQASFSLTELYPAETDGDFRPGPATSWRRKLP